MALADKNADLQKPLKTYECTVRNQRNTVTLQDGVKLSKKTQGNDYAESFDFELTDITSDTQKAQNTGAMLKGLEGGKQTTSIGNLQANISKPGAFTVDSAGDPLTFSTPLNDGADTYTFKVVEVQPAARHGWRFDKSEYHVTVTVAKNAAGQYEAKVTQVVQVKDCDGRDIAADKQQPADDLTALHQREIKEADGIVVVHPNWWGQPPAILKGWVDRVLREGVAYGFAEGDSGGGLPIGAVLMNEKVAEGMGPGTHGSTFGGNPVVCAGANVVVDRLDQSFLAQVSERAVQLRTGLAKLPHVKNISGIGLMVGIEFFDVQAADVLAACREKGLLVLTAKTRLRLLPPLTVSEHEVDMALDVLAEVLGTMEPTAPKEQA